MSSSLLRFVKEEESNGRGQLHWGRADVDGAPFRGNNIPVGTEDELESKLVKTFDAHNQIFDLSDPESNTEYIKVMTKILNGRAQILHREHLQHKIRRHDPQTKSIVTEIRLKVYLEWADAFMETYD